MSTPKDDLPVYKTFVVYCSVNGEDKKVRISAHNPVMALNWFHREMQDKREIKYTDYKITKLVHRYAAKATITPEWMLDDAHCIESDFDLPNTPNPDIKWDRKKKRDEREAPDPTKVMDFYDQVTNPAPEKK